MNKKLYEKLIQYILDHQDRFYRLAYSYTKNQEDALDAVQNAVCKALEAYDGIRNADAIKTWFYRILINECLRVIKKRKQDAVSADIEEQDAVYYEKAFDRENVDDELESKFRGVSRVKFYLSDDDEGRALLETIRAGIGREITTTCVQDSDWENNWRQYYQPIEIGDKLVVVPEWLETPDDGRIPLRLDPGLIFGTGSHATTRMCLAALEHYAAPGKRVLDLGCGSGILGIGALLLGCAHVTGCDIDPKAPEVAAANAALNGFYEDKFTVCAGDILADAGLRRRLGTGYDIVLANIVADVIIPLAALVPAFLTPGGTFVCSGIIDGREDEVAAALTRAGFTVTAHDTLEEWHCFTAVLA